MSYSASREHADPAWQGQLFAFFEELSPDNHKHLGVRKISGKYQEHFIKNRRSQNTPQVRDLLELILIPVKFTLCTIFPP